MDLSPELSSMAEALVATNDQLLALYDLSSVSTNSLDEDATVDEILTRSVELLSCDSILVSTNESEHFNGDRSTRQLLDNQPEGLDRSCLAIVQTTNAFGLEAELRALRQKSPFTTGDRKLLSAVLQTALGAIHNSRLHRQSVRQAIVTHDHKTAARVAQLVLPEAQPTLPGLEWFARSDPAQAAGGDFFTYAVVDDILHFAVGDVSGKGVAAAMMMTTATTAANASFRDRGCDGPADRLELVSEWTYDHLTNANMFTTLLLGSYRPEDGQLLLSNAGHSPVYVLRQGEPVPSEAHVPPVGVLPITGPDQVECFLAEGDALIVGSDGMVEQESPSDEWFGEDRFTALLSELSHKEAGHIGASLFAEVDDFSDGRSANDDRTLVVIQRKTPTVKQADELTIKADHESLRKIKPWLLTFLSKLPEQELGRIELAVHELTNNCVDHASIADGVVALTGRMEDNTVVIGVKDPGVEFNEAEVTSPDPDVPQVRGYGLMIIEQLTDELSYSREGEHNLWQVTFNLNHHLDGS